MTPAGVPATFARMSTLRIATLNCLNLALAGRAFYASTDPYTPDEYRAKTRWLAQLLDRMDADLVLLQEIFHEQALVDVVQQTTGHALKYFVPLADAHNTRPRLGMVWRADLSLQLESVEQIPAQCVVDIPELGAHQQYSRPLLQATVALPGLPVPLTVLNVHLKSRRPRLLDSEDPNDPAAQTRGLLRSLIMRGAEAAAIRQQVIEARLQNAAPLIVAGDFNDGPHAVSTQLIAQAGAAHPMFNAMDWVPHQALSHTHLHEGQPERIDHVYLSEEFAPQSDSVLGCLGCVSCAQVFNEHLSASSVTQASGHDLTRLQSDHAAVCITLEFKSI